MQLWIQYILYQLIYVLHLTIDIFLKHPKTLSLMKYLKSCQSTQHIHRFVSGVVNPIIWILIKYVQNRNQQIFTQISINGLCKKRWLVQMHLLSFDLVQLQSLIPEAEVLIHRIRQWIIVNCRYNTALETVRMNYISQSVHYHSPTSLFG